MPDLILQAPAKRCAVWFAAKYVTLSKARSDGYIWGWLEPFTTLQEVLIYSKIVIENTSMY